MRTSPFDNGLAVAIKVSSLQLLIDFHLLASRGLKLGGSSTALTLVAVSDGEIAAPPTSLQEIGNFTSPSERN